MEIVAMIHKDWRPTLWESIIADRVFVALMALLFLIGIVLLLALNQ